tara:strand:- start:1305 stop:2315 length:1011 start_codon:yes stop_codon:yes gene_type:complete
MNVPRKADPISAEPVSPEVGKPYYDSDSVLDLRAILWQLVKWSWIAVIFAGFGFYEGYKDTKAFQPKYIASMVLEPNSDGGGFSFGSSAPVAGVGGVAASLSAAFGGGGGNASNALFERLKLAMSSLELARRLDQKYQMLRTIYASQWDAEANDWKVPVEEEPTFMQRFRRSLHQDQSMRPSLEALSRFVNGTITFEEVGLTGFWRVKVANNDKERAMELLNQIYWTADELLRDQDRVKIHRKIEYLESRISQTATVDFRRALIAALVKEEHSAHLLEGGLPYAADVVQEAFVSDMRTSPILIKTLGVPTIAGAAIGMFIVLLIAVFRAESKKPRL